MQRNASQEPRHDPLTSPLLTEQAVADMLGMTLPGLQRLRRQGAGPPHVQLSPKLIRYQPGAVETWIATNAREVAAS